VARRQSPRLGATERGSLHASGNVVPELRRRPAFLPLLARGAFLVSADLSHGTVAGIRTASEKGCPCTVKNPWPGKPIRLTRNQRAAETLTGERMTFATTTGESITLAPQSAE